MKIALIQHDIIWCDIQKNLRRVEELVKECAGSQLCLLPEMFSTGFCTDPKDVAEPSKSGFVLQWMTQLSAKTGIALAGSVAVKEDDSYKNRFYFVRPDGHITCYDKRHLFAYGNEDQHFLPGEKRVIAEYDGVRFLLQTCFDLRFPVWSRFRGDYDVILYVANWPQSRSLAWNTLLRARAIENQCYVAGVNRVGQDPQCIYVGDSAIIHPYGHALASCESGRECVITTDLDMEALYRFREKFPMEIEE